MSEKYRVRDNDQAGRQAGRPDKIYGENLNAHAAGQLKERIAGARISKTVMVEPMSSPTEGTTRNDINQDPQIVEARAAAKRAAKSSAQQAQARHDEMMRQQNIREQVSRMQAPQVPEFDEGDLDGDDDEVDAGDVSDLLGDDDTNGVGDDATSS